MHYKIALNKKTWCVILIVIILISLVIRSMFFTEKMLGTSTDLLPFARYGNVSGVVDDDTSYEALSLFYYINFFDINSVNGWSVYMSIVFFFINILLLKDIRKIQLNKFLIILTSLVLWYLFSAGLTKEIIQTLFYFSIYYLINITNGFLKNKLWLKILLGSTILYISSIIFRPYYIIVALYTIVVYIIALCLRKKQLKSMTYIILLLGISFISIALFLMLASSIMPLEYDMIINLRTRYAIALMETTDSFIGNLINGDNLVIYMLNYIINYFRLLFPVELLLIGKIYYLPFIIYEICFAYYYIKSIVNLNKINNIKFVSLIFITSFLIVSTMMEPDFGSWVRHQGACYMLFISLLKD